MARRTSDAYSLLETVLASFIFLAIVIGLMSVWSTHKRAIAKARSIMIANELAERAMERCVAARFQMVPEFDGFEEDFNVQFVIKDRPITKTFKTLVTVRDFSTSIREVIVEVRWEDKTGERSVKLQTQLHSSA